MLQRMERDVAAVGLGAEGPVRLFASASAIAESLPDDVAAFMREEANRDVQVDIEERLSSDLVRAVAPRSACAGTRPTCRLSSARRTGTTAWRWPSIRIARSPAAR